MSGFRASIPTQLTRAIVLALLTIVGCNNGGGGSSVTAPTGLSYPIPAPFVVGEVVSPLQPALGGGSASLYEVAPELPGGLELDAATGELSGVPTEVTPTADYTITASNSLGSTDFVLQLTVNPPAPCGLSYSEPVAAYPVGEAIAPNTASVGCGAVETWTITPALPDGLSLDPLTGEISGTPTAVVATTIHTVVASNITGADSFDLEITVNPEVPCGLAFTDPAPTYNVNTPIAPNAGSSACGPVAAWAVDPALPAGLVLDAQTGIITGSPLAVLAPTVFTVTGSNASGSASIDLLIEILPEVTTGITYGDTAPTYIRGIAITPNAPSISGGAPSDWSVDPALPGGLLLDPSTGVISGTPDQITATLDHVITGSNAAGSLSTTISITIAPQAPCNLSYTSTDAVYLQGMPITANILDWGCDAPDAIVISPALPAGLSLDPATGTISGTPADVTPTTTHTVTASNATGSESIAVTITVNPQAPCNLGYDAEVVTYLAGLPIAPNSPALGCGPAAQFAVSPALPAGLDLDAATGVITGVPTVVAPASTHTVSAINVTGSASVILEIRIDPQAPSNLSYSEPSPVYQLDLPITANTPSASGGAVDGFAITPGLPTGLTLDPVTGVISGTPTVLVGPTLHTITATNVTGSAATTILVEIVPQPPCSLAYGDATPVLLLDMPSAPNPASFACGTPDLWEITPALPAGLQLDPVSGTISGTPTELLPTTTFFVTATNDTGSSSVSIILTVNPQAPCDLTYAFPSSLYLAGIQIPVNPPSWGCGDPASFTVSPPLPAGLLLHPATGVISGTPSLPTGASTHTITASNVTGSDSFQLSIAVDPQAPCDFEYASASRTYVIGTASAANIPSWGCGDPQGFSVTPPLPAGLSIDPVSGAVLGIPTELQELTVHMITATNVTGTDTTTIAITVNPEAPCALTYADLTPIYVVGSGIAPNSASFACGPPDLYTISPPLPAGLMISAATGQISGIPTEIVPAAIYTVTGTNPTGSDSVDLLITVNPKAPCDIAYSDETAVYLVGTPIAANLPSWSCGDPESWTITPALPNGLLLDASTGAITGTPAVVSPLTDYTVTATNVTGSDSRVFSIQVNPQGPCGLAYPDPSPLYTQNVPITPNVPTTSCGTPTGWIVTPALPAGLQLDAMTGVVSGTPTILVEDSVHVVAASNVTGTETFTLTITVQEQAPCNLQYTFMAPTYHVGTAIGANVPSWGCGVPGSFSVSPALPAGLSLHPVTGILTGTPLALVPTTDFVVSAANLTGSAEAILTITVSDPPPCSVAYPSANAVYEQGLPITPNMPSWACGDPESWSIAPALPAGLALDPLTGVISGTPLDLLPPTLFLVTAENVSGEDKVQISIEVVEAAPCALSYADNPVTYQMGLAITPNPASHGCGAADSFTVTPALPAGLLLDPLTGEISGTPTTLAASTVHTITASNGTGSSSTDLVIEVVPQPPCGIAYDASASIYLLGDTITPNLASFSCGAPESWSISPPLPLGLTLDATTGAISGAPLALAAATDHTITAVNVTGQDSTVISIAVHPQAPAGLSYGDAAPVYVEGIAIAANEPSSTGGAIDAFSVTPALPVGLALDPATGAISGTPGAVQGAVAYTITASNITGSTDATVTITVNPPAPADLAYGEAAPIYLLGDAIVPNAPTSSGGPVTAYSIDPALPAGLLLDPTTGVISGTPAELAPTTAHTVTASNVTGSATATIMVTVNPQGTGTLTYTDPAPTYLRGVAITPNAPIFGGGTPDSFSISPPLPAGLQIDPLSGVISGTPTVLQAATLHTVTASNVTGSASATIMITVNPQAPSGLMYRELVSLYLVGDAIVPNTPTVNGDVDAFSVAPALPAGLSIDAQTGAISGVPTAITAAATYTVTASNITGSNSVNIVITVDPQAPAGLTYPELSPTYLLDLAITPNAPSSTGGPIAAFGIAPALPAGLSLDPSTGVISGTPTTLHATTVHTVTATNVTGATTVDIAITVNPQAPSGLSYSAPSAVYLLDLAITPNSPSAGGGAIDAFAITPALPAGLALDPVTGVISGVPTALQAATTHTVTATNVTGTATAEVVITVDPQAPAGLTYGELAPTYVVGTAIGANLPSVGGGEVAGFSVAPALPAGLQLDPLTGGITGTPTTITAVATYTVTASNVTGSSSVDLVITVNPAAPAGLAYGETAPTYLLGDAITPNLPTSTGGPIAGFTISPALPAGLALDPTSGAITGTPAALHATRTHTITGSNVTGSTSASITITVNPQAPIGLTYTELSPTYITGSAITPNLAAVTGDVDTFTVVPALPAGLTLDPATGIILGTPSADTPQAIYTVTATNVTGTSSVDLTITVNPPAPVSVAYPAVNSTYLLGVEITPNVPVISGGTPTSWVVNPALPAGLAMDPATGVITGTPTVVQNAGIFVINAANVTGSASTILIIAVENPAPCGLAYPIPSLALLTATPLPPQVPTVGCGVADSFAISPALPAGLTLDPATGAIQGTPTTPAPSTIHTVTATNGFGSDSAQLVISVALTPPTDVDFGATAFDFVVGDPITPITPTAAGGPVDGWSVSPGLPSGLTLDGMTGTISGTPTIVDAGATYLVSASNSAGSAQQALTIRVVTNAPCEMAYSEPLAVYPVGHEIAPNTPIVGCGGATSFTIDPVLATGLAFDAGTGVISGAPLLRTGRMLHTVTATNAFGSTTATVEIQTSPRYTYDAPDTTVTLDATGAGSFTLPLTIDEDVPASASPTEAVGLSVALAFDPALLQLSAVTQGPGLLDLNGVDYFYPGLNNIDGQLTIGVIISFSFTKVLVVPDPTVFAVADFEVPAAGAPTQTTETSMTWANLVGSPPVDNLVVLDGSAGGGIQPLFEAPTITIVPTP